jgi:hypothetical protein
MNREESSKLALNILFYSCMVVVPNFAAAGFCLAGHHCYIALLTARPASD